MTDTTSPALRTALAYYQAWTGHDLDRAMSYIADDIVCDAPAGRLRGAAAYRGFMGPFVQILRAATLIAAFGDDRIAELIPHGRADLERYRPNIVIRTAAAGFTENDWLERTLRVGEDLVLRVIARTPRCAVPTLAHGALLRNPEALRVLARHNRVEPMDSVDPEPCAGVYAEVLRPGRIRTGDLVRLA